MVYVKKSPAKIRRTSVKLKKNGLHLIPYDQTTEFRRADMLVQDAHALAIQGDGEPVHGYVIVTWDKTGRREHAYNWRDQNIIAAQAIPQFVADCLTEALKSKGYIDGF